jgi:transcriptional regulator with XRE-family HTH domain
MTMAETIRMLRLQRGITQEELGKIIGVQKSAIRKYESGMVENIPRSSIKRMADFFEVAPSYLMGWEDETPAPEELSEGERAWIELYRKLSPDVRETFVTMVKKFDSLPEGERQMLLAMIRGALGSQAK